MDEWSSEFNWDGLTIWDTVATFQHYPGEPPEPACLADGRCGGRGRRRRRRRLPLPPIVIVRTNFPGPPAMMLVNDDSVMNDKRSKDT